MSILTTILKFSANSRCFFRAPWIGTSAPITADRVEAINPKDLERLLYPLLKADDRPTVPAMVKAVTPLFQTILDHNREEAYLEAIANGRYRPELLFPKDPEIIERIRQHPALLWKADNVARHVSRSRKHS